MPKLKKDMRTVLKTVLISFFLRKISCGQIVLTFVHKCYIIKMNKITVYVQMNKKR